MVSVVMGDVMIIDAWMGKRTERVPLWLMRQAGRYLPEYREIRAKAGGFLAMAYNPEYAIEITLQPLKRFDLDAAILFSDILVLPHALGLKLEFLEGEGPKLETVSSEVELSKLQENGFLQRLQAVLDAVAGVKAKMPQSKALIGFAGSPWTVASYMVEGQGGHDFVRIKNWAFHDPAGFQRLMDLLVRTTVEYLSAQIQAGAQAVQIFESWAGMLAGDDFVRWIAAPNAAIVKALKTQHPHVPVIGFPRTDNAVDVARYVAEIGVNAVGLSQGIEPAWAAQNLQPKVCVQGNLAPELLLQGGRAMLDGVENICMALDGGPFVFNLGHGVIKETDPDHVAALVDAVHGFKRKALAA